MQIPTPNLDTTDPGNRIEESRLLLWVLPTIKGEEGGHTQPETSCPRPGLTEMGHWRGVPSSPREAGVLHFFLDRKVVSTHYDLPKDQVQMNFSPAQKFSSSTLHPS